MYIKDVFHYLQAKSNNYPFIDGKVIKKYLFEKMQYSNNSYFLRHSLWTILEETCMQSEAHSEGQSKINYYLNRAMFTELLYRMGLLLFSNRRFSKQK